MKPTMRYLIMQKGDVFGAEWYDYGHHYAEDTVIIDTLDNKVSFNGVDWDEIEEYEM